MADQSSDRELKNALAQIEKQFGKGAIMQLGSSTALDVTGISTGALSLDIALGGRGIPRGRIVEIFGPESSGKTTVALHAVAQAQRLGGVAAYIDAEHALDPSWVKRIGVDLESLLISQPSSAEEALKIAEMLIKSNAVDIIVIDSVAALVPRAEVEGEIGVMFGNPETTSGGLALKFYSSVRLDIRKITTVKDGEETVGSRVKVRVVKNKVAPPFKTAEFDLMHDRGISREGDLIDLAVEDKIIEKSGSWISYGDIRLGQGRENAKQYLRDNPALIEEISRKVLEKRGLTGTTQPSADGDGEAAPPVKAETPKKESNRRQPATAE